jgi:hypothetical protein
MMANDVHDVDHPDDGQDDRQLHEDLQQEKADTSGTPATAGGPTDDGKGTAAYTMPDLSAPPVTLLGYEVHPDANNFPLMQPDEFKALCEELLESKRIRIPIEISDGKLTDGRNRALAVEALRGIGVAVAHEFVTWTPADDETLVDRIIALNKHRRRETPDQIAAAACKFLPAIRKQSEQRQKASRFTRASNPRSGTAAQSAKPPSKRDSRTKNEQSTAGTLAKKFGISRHMANQVVALDKAIAEGRVAPSTLDDVLYGRSTLRAALPAARRRSNQAPKDADQRVNPFSPRSPNIDRSEWASTPLNPASLWGKPSPVRPSPATDDSVEDSTPPTPRSGDDLHEAFVKAWAAFCDEFDDAEIRPVFDLVMRKIKADKRFVGPSRRKQK